MEKDVDCLDEVKINLVLLLKCKVIRVVSITVYSIGYTLLAYNALRIKKHYFRQQVKASLTRNSSGHEISERDIALF